MNWLVRFWRQPSRRYRNFQIVFALLFLNFAIPTLSYAFTPEAAMAQFGQLNELLGGVAYQVPEAQSHFWRYLGTANVAALAFMCFLLPYDLRKYRPVLVPLTFLKATAATLWLVGYLQAPQYPAFLAAAVLDYVTSACFVYFAGRAHSAIRDVPDAALVPRPAVQTPLGWTRLEFAWAEALFDGVLPGDEAADLPPASEATRPQFWQTLRDKAPPLLRVGFRASVWLLTWMPVVYGFGFCRFAKLERADQDRFLAAVADSRVFVFRQLVTTVKHLACMAYFGDQAARRRVQGAS